MRRWRSGGAHVDVPLAELERGELAPVRARGDAGRAQPAAASRPDGAARRASAPDAPGDRRSRRRRPTARPRGGRDAPGRSRRRLDLRGARVDEALELLDQTLDQAALAGAGRVTVIHGHGIGRPARRGPRPRCAGHPLVREWRPGERGEGGDGATIVSL